MFWEENGREMTPEDHQISIHELFEEMKAAGLDRGIPLTVWHQTDRTCHLTPDSLSYFKRKNHSNGCVSHRPRIDRHEHQKVLWGGGGLHCYVEESEGLGLRCTATASPSSIAQ